MRARLVVAVVLAWSALTAGAAAAPVLSGDYPDPTLVRAPAGYVASMTSSEWAPAFPVFTSSDLRSWRQVGAVLDAPPAWAAGRFWAPELAVGDDGGLLAYWGAARRDGPPCIALSTAPRPEGPWRYRGRVVCPASGAIDAAAFRDTDGSRWLLWKALTPGGFIMLQRLTDDGRRPVGAAVPLLGPDAPWEDGVIEAPSVVRAGGRLLMVYAGGRCCRVPCSYATGVASATAITGPWTKATTNPLIMGGTGWRCPGHGTAVDLGANQLAVLHHATAAADVGQRRRFAVLSLLGLDPEGAPVLLSGAGEAGPPVAAPSGFRDTFATAALDAAWQWPYDWRIRASVRDDGLDLSCEGPLRFVARQVAADRYTATATLAPGVGDAAVGLGVAAARTVRGVELQGGRARAFVAGPRGARRGPAVAVARDRPVRLLVTVAPGGYLAAYVASAGGDAVRLNAGPAARGEPPTRVALSCRGRGAGRITSVTATPG